MNDFNKSQKTVLGRKGKINTESPIGSVAKKISDSELKAEDSALMAVQKHEVTLSEGVHKVQEYREKIIKKGAKFKNPYSLKIKKKSLVKTSLILAAIFFVAFYVFSYFYLVKLKKDGSLAYAISRVTPYYLKDTDGRKISYSDYLFELRHELHYLENKEGLAIHNPDHKDQYEDLKAKSLEKASEITWSKKQAKKLGIKVSNEEVDRKIDILTSQFGQEGKDSLAIALSTYYGWKMPDLKRSIKEQLIKQKVTYKLDTKLNEKKLQLDSEIQQNVDFAALVDKYSEDQISKAAKGSIAQIGKQNTALPPEVIDSIFSMQISQVSPAIETAKGLYRVKLDAINEDGTRNASIIIIKISDFASVMDQNK